MIPRYQGRTQELLARKSFPASRPLLRYPHRRRRRQPRQSDQHGFEISRQNQLSRPVVAFATSASTLPLRGAALRTVLIDSNEFRFMMMTCGVPSPADPAAETLQIDPAAIHICEKWNSLKETQSVEKNP
ncbi:hypothetical protein QJS10_CPA16g00168 [Acorus calamus]|uniref:Uncharacterized protein n=1 Tax=Acorus calamus TaxID=4465 RepID=A0AAV9D1V6_ACOCL|nr:hypothetical protein QJS10_CPA16g00168 [Acorus calamus]